MTLASPQVGNSLVYWLSQTAKNQEMLGSSFWLDVRDALKQGFQPGGRERPRIKSVISWEYLYQWGDTIDVRVEADTKRLGTPALKHKYNENKGSQVFLNIQCDHG